MTKGKDLKSQTKPCSKKRESTFTDECALPSEQERLPLHVPGAYQIAMGTGEEIATWLRGVPGNDRAILIPFPNDASYRAYGPIYWHIAKKLPEIVARVQRRKFEQLVEALMWSLRAPPGGVLAQTSHTKARPAKGKVS